MDKNNENILVRLPKQLKKEFRIICIQENTNMSDTIRQLVEDYVYKKR
ncbi:ribbon-helix-helix protein, CopG family [Methanobrevibacter sp.]